MGAVHLCFKGGFNCKVTVIKVNIKKKLLLYIPLEVQHHSSLEEKFWA